MISRSFVRESLAELLYSLPVGSWPEYPPARGAAFKGGETKSNEEGYIFSGFLEGDIVERFVTIGASRGEREGKPKGTLQLEELFGYGLGSDKIGRFPSKSSQRSVLSEKDSFLKAGNS